MTFLTKEIMERSARYITPVAAMSGRRMTSIASVMLSNLNRRVHDALPRKVWTIHML